MTAPDVRTAAAAERARDAMTADDYRAALDAAQQWREDAAVRAGWVVAR